MSFFSLTQTKMKDKFKIFDMDDILLDEIKLYPKL